MSAYTEFVKKHRAEGKSMKEIGTLWRKEKAKGQPTPPPAMPSDTPLEPTTQQSSPNKEPSVADLQQQIKELSDQLRATADKGRLMKYEMGRQGKKPFRIHLSRFQGGYITQWRTIKDVLIKNPTTGRTVGEEQQYEVVVLLPDNSISKHVINSYPAFTDARYTDRVEVEVIGKKEGFDGTVAFTLMLPDGRNIDLDARFVN